MLRPLALALLAVLACDDASGPGAREGMPRVLFVGNSLTEWNDLASMVRAVSESAGVPLVTGSITFGGYSLEDHWAEGSAREALATRRWDVVVLQQGPSALPESRANLREWAVRWADAIRAAGAEPVLYMPWPDASRMSAFDSVSLSYREAAAAANARVIPGGEAWQAAWRRDPGLALYGSDAFHPSALGSYVVAVAAWARITGGVPAAAPQGIRAGVTLRLDPATATIVRQAVTEALAR